MTQNEQSKIIMRDILYTHEKLRFVWNRYEFTKKEKQNRMNA